MSDLAIIPVGKPRMTQRDKWAQRPSVVKYRRYCDQLREWLGPDYDLPGDLQVTFRLPMPKTWGKRKQEAKDGTPHDGKPDIDNLAKGFMDAFKKEDKHVYRLYAEKYWARAGSITIRN